MKRWYYTQALLASLGSLASFFKKFNFNFNFRQNNNKNNKQKKNDKDSTKKEEENKQGGIEVVLLNVI